MRRLPLLLTLVVGVALWAAPSHAQAIGSWFKQYTANSAAPGEGNVALQNGYVMCPPHADYCSGVASAYHHIAPATDGGAGYAVYATNVLNTENCKEVVVKVKELDNDNTVAQAYVQYVLNDAGDGNLCANPKVALGAQTYILADINGDGVIDANDEIPMDGDDGSDSDGDGTAQQTGAMYGIVANRIRMCIMRTGGALADLATDSSYVEVSCR